MGINDNTSRQVSYYSRLPLIHFLRISETVEKYKPSILHFTIANLKRIKRLWGVKINQD